MSGGTFDYAQHAIDDIIADLSEIIEGAGTFNKDWDCKQYDYSEETLDEFKTGLELLRLASIYAQRIDWLCAGDDGEATFKSRLREDLKGVKIERIRII